MSTYTDLYSKESEIFSQTVQLISSLFFNSVPSTILKSILIKNNLNDPVFILESKPINKIDLSVKSTLNSIAGKQLSIQLINGNIYVGSASI